jgi:hypothetical protein
MAECSFYKCCYHRAVFISTCEGDKGTKNTVEEEMVQVMKIKKIIFHDELNHITLYYIILKLLCHVMSCVVLCHVKLCYVTFL